MQQTDGDKCKGFILTFGLLLQMHSTFKNVVSTEEIKEATFCAYMIFHSHPKITRILMRRTISLAVSSCSLPTPSASKSALARYPKRWQPRGRRLQEFAVGNRLLWGRRGGELRNENAKDRLQAEDGSQQEVCSCGKS